MMKTSAQYLLIGLMFGFGFSAANLLFGLGMSLLKIAG